MIDAKGHGAHDSQGTQAGTKASDEQPTSQNLRERSQIRHRYWEWDVKWSHKRVSKVLDAVQFFVSVMDKHDANRKAEQKEP
jgi:hypothetical protein